MKRHLFISLMIGCSMLVANAQEQTLAEKLGYKKTDRLLIVNSDDAGMCHSANTAIMEGMEKGNITSTTIMPPCPWFNEIAEYARTQKRTDRSFGVHLTLTSEWKKYRWGSVAPRNEVPSLYDKEGYLWRDVEPVYANSTPRDALIEGRAQIRKVMEAGVPVTHIDSHMGTYQYNIDYMHVYLQLADEFNLPARMPSAESLIRMGQPTIRAEFEKRGIVMTDHFVFEELQEYKKVPVKTFWMNIIKNLKPGVTELFIHANHMSEEIKSISSTNATREAEFNCFTNDEEVKKLLKDEGIILISYKPLFELQRKQKQ